MVLGQSQVPHSPSDCRRCHTKPSPHRGPSRQASGRARERRRAASPPPLFRRRGVQRTLKLLVARDFPPPAGGRSNKEDCRRIFFDLAPGSSKLGAPSAKTSTSSPAPLSSSSRGLVNEGRRAISKIGRRITLLRPVRGGDRLCSQPASLDCATRPTRDTAVRTPSARCARPAAVDEAISGTAGGKRRHDATASRCGACPRRAAPPLPQSPRSGHAHGGALPPDVVEVALAASIPMCAHSSAVPSARSTRRCALRYMLLKSHAVLGEGHTAEQLLHFVRSNADQPDTFWLTLDGAQAVARVNSEEEGATARLAAPSPVAHVDAHAAVASPRAFSAPAACGVRPSPAGGRSHRRHCSPCSRIGRGGTRLRAAARSWGVWASRSCSCSRCSTS